MAILKWFLALSRGDIVRIFVGRGNMEFETSKVFIGEDVHFDDSRPELITVGKWVRITTGVRIFTHFFDTKFVPQLDRPFRFYDGEVKIGGYVFIGANVVIAKPVVIGYWAVIRANTVTTHDIPAGAIMAGNPARQIGVRDIGELHDWPN